MNEKEFFKLAGNLTLEGQLGTDFAGRIATQRW